MGLVNIGFILLCVKLGSSVVPIVLGIYLLAMSEETRRELRGKLCRQIFGVTNAIPYKNFSRSQNVLAVFLILFGVAMGWFLVLSRYFA